MDLSSLGVSKTGLCRVSVLRARRLFVAFHARNTGSASGSIIRI